MDLIRINVGGLRSISSVYQNTSMKLLEFNEAWKKGVIPSIEWDLTEVKPGQINVAAASFFLAIAHRVRQYSGKYQPIRIDWHPKTLGFLEDVGFFKVAKDYDLFKWPYEIGGYENDQINPNTKILAYGKLSNKPDPKIKDDLSEWKKVHREYYRKSIISKCEALFLGEDDSYRNENYPLVISRTCAEIAVNSLLWGESAAFLGLQRARSKIFISVCDIGLGFQNGFYHKDENTSFLSETKVDKDIAALALGSIVNKNDFGLKRAISTVIDLGGDISLSSGKGEIIWGKKLWDNYLNSIDVYGVYEAINRFPAPVFKSDSILRESGYCRSWKASIRGSRISFYIPLEGMR